MRIIDERRLQTTTIPPMQSRYDDIRGQATPVAARRGQVWRFPNFVRRIAARIGVSWQRHSSVKLLSGMSEYELAEIGPHRGQLYGLFNFGFAGRTSTRQQADDDLQEHIMADLGLSYRLPRPLPNR